MIKEKIKKTRDWMNMKETAEYLGVSVTTLSQIIDSAPVSQPFPCTRTSKRTIRVNRNHLNDWMLSYNKKNTVIPPRNPENIQVVHQSEENDPAIYH